MCSLAEKVEQSNDCYTGLISSIINENSAIKKALGGKEADKKSRLKVCKQNLLNRLSTGYCIIENTGIGLLDGEIVIFNQDDEENIHITVINSLELVARVVTILGTRELLLSEKEIKNALRPLESIYDPSEVKVFTGADKSRHEKMIVINRYNGKHYLPYEYEVKGQFKEQNMIDTIVHTWFLMQRLFVNTENIEWVINWLLIHQRWKEKPGTALFSINSKEGVGKGVFVKHFITPVYGQSNVAETTSQGLTSNFSEYLTDNMFISLEELYIAGNKDRADVAGKLKNMITEKRLYVNRKYKTEESVNTYMVFYGQSNKPDPLPFEKGSRRDMIITPLSDVRLDTAVMDEFKMNMDEFLEEVEREAKYFRDTVIQKYEGDRNMARHVIQTEEKEELIEAVHTKEGLFREILLQQKVQLVEQMLDDAEEIGKIDSTYRIKYEKVISLKNTLELPTHEWKKSFIAHLKNCFNANLLTTEMGIKLYRLLYRMDDDKEVSEGAILSRGGRMVGKILNTKKKTYRVADTLMNARIINRKKGANEQLIAGLLF